MKKIKEIFKNNLKIVIAFILGIIISGTTVYAATILYNANQVGFDNSDTSLSSTDVQGALDELYTKANTWIDPNKEIVAMQNFNPSSIPSVGNSAVVYDSRDGNRYIVRRLADGKVWMTQNLRIINKTISSSDSNLPEGVSWTIPSSSLSNFSGADKNAAYLNTNFGGYYSFYTATAGWGTSSVSSGTSPRDICPKGWRLPIGGSSGEFVKLYNKYPSSALMRKDPGFVLSGNIRINVFGNSSNGYYWSSTVTTADIASSYYISSSSVLLDGGYKDSSGFSVRCIAK